MNKVSIGFSKPKKWKIGAWAIQKIEGTTYSHVFVIWHCKNIDRNKVFESIGSGIRILSDVNFRKKAQIIDLYHFYVDDKTLYEIEQEAHDMTGKPYGYMSLIGLCIMRLFNFFNRTLNLRGHQHNPFKDRDYSQVCVETAGMVLKKIKELPINFEDYGLIEMIQEVKCGEKATQDELDELNGKISKKK